MLDAVIHARRLVGGPPPGNRRSVGTLARRSNGLYGDAMELPTLGDVLALPALRAGEPVLRAGADAVPRRRVRWVHVSEVSDIAHLLEGGELILTTGIALPSEPAPLATYVDELAAVG